jgi:hypothetical protein
MENCWTQSDSSDRVSKDIYRGTARVIIIITHNLNQESVSPLLNLSGHPETQPSLHLSYLGASLPAPLFGCQADQRPKEATSVAAAQGDRSRKPKISTLTRTTSSTELSVSCSQTLLPARHTNKRGRSNSG